MNLLSFFNRRTSAPVARDRLQLLLAHERTVVGGRSSLRAASAIEPQSTTAMKLWRKRESMRRILRHLNHGTPSLLRIS